VVGIGDPLDVLVGQFPVGAVRHAAELPGIDEEDLAAAVDTLSLRERVARSAG